MIAITTLHNEVRLTLNLINNSWSTSINAIDIDSYINKAKDYIVHNYSKIVERDSTLETMLRELEVPYKDLRLKQESNKDYVLAKLPRDYHRYLSLKVIGEKECIKDSKPFICKDQIWNTRYFQRNDVSLNDINWEPSWNWRSGLYNFNEKGLYFYHNQKYKVDSIELTYIKTIPDVAAVSLVKNNKYVRSDGKTVTKDQGLLVTNPFLWRKICDIASYYIRKDKDGKYREQIESVIFNENTAVS